jgi:glucose-6-phosphate isomerase
MIRLTFEEQEKDITILKKYSNISKNELLLYKKNIKDEIYAMNKTTRLGYHDDRCSINLPFDESILRKVNHLVKEKKATNPEYIIVVGIGGSNLGTLAVQEVILGKLHNQKNSTIKILYADTVDSDIINDIIEIIEPILKKGKDIIISLISKSGGTTETISNFLVLSNILEKYRNNPEKYIVVITDKHSKLWYLAEKKNYSILEIPNKVGGRFSIFSAVGLFPLAMMGINIKKLLDGAQKMQKRCLNHDILKNPAALSAMIIYYHYLNGKNIHDLFLFGSDFESVGKWYRQLMAESLGKEFDTEGKRVLTGITPTVSIGSIDLHSMVQLYLGGPYDKFTKFVVLETNKTNINLPDEKSYESLVKGIKSKKMKEIMDAIFIGTKNAYIKGKRPFMEIILPNKSEESIGQFLQMQMMEIMYLGALMEINPFNQPNIESYKIETRKELEK